jgi:hypothetical protein
MRDEGGETHHAMHEEDVKEAINTQSIQRAPGPEKITFQILRLL